jgi:ribonuclease BN (tRNA processing enzyme)
MRFTVLGKSPAWQDAGGACSSYLVEEGEYRLVVDCGNGAFAKLRERLSYALVDDVLISHVHADHVLDLAPFAYALTLGLPPGQTPPRPRLFLPPGGGEKMRTLVSIWGSEGLLDDAFEISEYERDGALELGPLAIDLHQVPHFTLTHAIGITAPSGKRLVYGADCRAGPELEAAASGADVLVAEATLQAPEHDSVPLAHRGHMSAGEAAAVAAAAGVGTLVLTHISDQLDHDAAVAAAREQFDGTIETATEGAHWDL